MTTIKRENWIITYIKGNPLQVTLQIIGVGVLVLNLFLASKLSPLVTDLRLLRFQVDAVEKQIGDDREKINSIEVLEANLKNIDANLEDVKQTVGRIEDRMYISN